MDGRIGNDLATGDYFERTWRGRREPKTQEKQRCSVGQLSFAYFPLFAQRKVWPGEKSFKKVLPGLDEAPIFF